jgi:catechol 2,3-dioxygenase-like lactoylglutathione lyase family enzyme
MFTKIVYMTVFVRDQERALDFYTRTLGFEKRVDNHGPGGARFLGVGLPGQDFLLVLSPGTPGAPDPKSGPAPGAVVMETGDCRKVFESLVKLGVEFETPEPRAFPWGLVAIAKDLDGNRLQIVERPKA